MTRQDAAKWTGWAYLPTALAIILGAMLALAGFETKGAHDADIKRILDAQVERDGRIVCMLQELKTPVGRICP